MLHVSLLHRRCPSVNEKVVNANDKTWNLNNTVEAGLS